MAEDYGVSLKITADTSDLDKVPQNVEATRKEIERPVEQTVVEKREPAAPVEHAPETVTVNEVRGTGVSPVQHPAETVAVNEQRTPAAPVEHAPETVEVREKRIVEETGGRERPAPAERTVTVKVVQDPDPLKINVEQPAPVKPKVEQPAPVKPKVEQPAPVKIEAKAEKIRVEVEDAEAKKRIEALTAEEGVKRIRVVTEGGELATRQGGKEIFELEVDAEKAKQTIADLKQDARIKVTADTGNALQKFNALHLVSSAMTGNFAAASAELAKLSSTLKSIGPGAFTAMGAAVYSIISAFGAARELFATIFNWNQPSAQIKEMGNTMNALVTKAREFAEAMDLERKAAEGVQTALKNQLDATLSLTKAQNELNRQRELGAAKTDEDRNRINAKYDAANASADTDNAQQQVELRRKSTLEEIARLEKEIGASKANQSKYEEIAKTAGGEANRLIKEEGGASVFKNWVSNTFGFNTDATKTRALLDKASEARGNAYDEEDRRAELAAAEKKLAEEMAKDAKDRDERRVSRAREDIRAAESTAVGARRQREDLETNIENRRAAQSQDYFGNLARQIDASRPKDRLVQMGIAGGDRASADYQRKISGDLQRAIELIREQVSLARAQSYRNQPSTYAP